MKVSHIAKNRKGVINIAVDVDLTLLDTLTPWLEAFGLTIDDLNKIDNRASDWTDLSPWLDEHGVSNPKYSKSYEFWNDGSIYKTAKENPGVVFFLKELKRWIEENTDYECNMFICSTCTVGHKEQKVKRIKELFGNMFNGFVDTSEKYLVDYDLLIDDSPNQNLNSFRAGKVSLLVPTPMNNVKNVHEISVKENLNNIEGYGAIIALGGVDIEHPEFGSKYNEFWASFYNEKKTKRNSILRSILQKVVDYKVNK